MSSILKSLEPIEYKGQIYYRQRDVVAKARPDGANPKEQARYYRDKMALEHGGVWGECLHLPYPDGKIRLTWCVTPEEAEEMAKRAAKKEKRSTDRKVRCIVAKSGEQFYPVIDLVKAKKPWLHYPEDEVGRLRIRLAINGASKRCGRDFYLEEGKDGHAVKTWCVSDWSRFDVERMMEGKSE